jgi:hypothetical protein
MSKIHVIVTTTKPAGAQWYRDVEPEKNRTLNNWVRNFSGLLFLWGRETTPTTWETIYEFTNRATYDAFTIEHDQQPIRNERKSYCESNGFTSTTEVVELPS